VETVATRGGEYQFAQRSLFLSTLHESTKAAIYTTSRLVKKRGAWQVFRE